MDFILDHLAIGSFEEAVEPSSEVDALLCVAQEHDVDSGSRKYHKVPIVDMQPIPVGQMEDAVNWIGDNITDHRIMVFCNAGIGRTPSVVVGYLCCALGYSFGDAVEHVANRKPYMSILPNLIQTIDEVKNDINFSFRFDDSG